MKNAQNKNDSIKYAQILSEMVKINTLSREDGKSDEMESFHAKMHELFPSILKVADLEVLYGCVILKWKGKDSTHRVLFMNHHDVVPATGNWTHGPFSGEISEGKLWGRGTLDTKGGLFGMMQAANELAEEGFVPSVDIWFESSCCEEITTGEIGSNLVSQKWEKEGIRFDWVLDEGGMIVYEPLKGAKGNFAMVGVGEKGSANIKFTAVSNGGHASTPPKDTPLVRLGKFMSFMDNHNPFEVQLTDVTCNMFKNFSEKISGPLKPIMRHPRLFSPVLKAVMTKSGTSNAIIRTTLAFTRSEGSEANNVIPQSAWVIGNMRYSHHEGQKCSIQKAVDIAKRFDIEAEVLDAGFESGISPVNSKGFNLIKDAVNSAFDGVITTPYIQNGASDSRFMSRVSDNVYRFVPFVVSDEQLATVHGIDENVDISTLLGAVAFYRYMMSNL